MLNYTQDVHNTLFVVCCVLLTQLGVQIVEICLATRDRNGGMLNHYIIMTSSQIHVYISKKGVNFIFI